MKIDVEKLLEENAQIVDKLIERYIPRKFDRSASVFSQSPPRYDFNIEALDKAIASPIWDFLDRGGKRWRPSLFLLVVEALGKDSKNLQDFAIIPEVIHNGTIMIDDIEDDSELRRGKPCTHKLFGLDVAINAGNSMYYLPLLTLILNRDKIGAEKLSRIYEIYIRDMINLSLGQAMDIAWHKGLADTDKLTETQYMQMCAYKTGTLARMAAEIASVLCEASSDTVERLGRFAEALGIAFQIQDDVLDLTSKEFAAKKGGRGQDITEGKRSLILIHTLEKAKLADKKRLDAILKMHTDDQKLKDEAIQIMKQYGSIEYARQFAKKLVTGSWEEVDRLLSPCEGKEKLKAFADYLVERGM
ncbi:MAG TPA: polyprenyl synthetase family protein [Candidatus Bathyarchaeia archaeon]|nr:polyprenyl synthetase family protein [Candidatus Bathyarchaeia archaeon]